MDLQAAPKAKNPHNSFHEKFELQFYQAFHTLKRLGCDYLYFLAVENGVSYRFCTHENWMDIYNTEKLILNDPLRRVAESGTFILVPWAQITHLHGNEKKTMCARVSHGLFNGMTISRQFRNRKYIFALATELREHDLARYLLLENMNKLEQVICNYTKLFDQHMRIMSNFNPTLM
ncbi:autoinducer binding domain-containing protein [Legionella sp. 16cNR16C]|uniref:autoinducer binding domain-containing protein n=1 Tax=Legionella sp. 16cNR16C TaxID=2905656 RepID=UPI001E464C42|nr:autoinducer binding domain-containing protein [Legionella sp. 16cNR16C]MCE3043961.1 autoinducer binding domain-containing protein [Legionella sp. 16cNR16C]